MQTFLISAWFKDDADLKWDATHPVRISSTSRPSSPALNFLISAWFKDNADLEWDATHPG